MRAAAAHACADTGVRDSPDSTVTFAGMSGQSWGPESPSQQAGERLYRLAQQNAADRQRFEEERANERSPFPHQPSTLARSREMASGRFSSKNGTYGEALYQEGIQREDSRRRMQASQRELSDTEEYTFTPTISDLARNMPISEPVEVRLEMQAAVRERRLQELHEKRRAEAERELTFKPSINDYDVASRPADFLEAVNAQQLRHKHMLSELQMKHQEEQGRVMTHQPQISEYSRSLVRDQPIHERLYSLARQRELERQTTQTSDARTVDPVTGAPLFRPQLSRRDSLGGGSSRSLGGGEGRSPDRGYGSDEGDGEGDGGLAGDDPVSRLQDYGRAREARLRAKQQEMEEELRRQSSRTKLNAKSIKLARQKLERDVRTVISEVDTAGSSSLLSHQLGEVLRRLGIFAGRTNGATGAGREGEARASEEDDLLNRLWRLLSPNREGHVRADDVVNFLLTVSDMRDSGDYSAGSLARQPNVAPEHIDEFLDLARKFSVLSVAKLAYVSTRQVRGKIDSNAECTFTPSINAAGSGAAPGSANRSTRSLSDGGSAAGDDEYQNGDGGDEGAGSPSAGDGQGRVRPATAGAGGVPRHELLYRHARVKDDKHKVERNKREQEELDGCTFAPRLVAESTARTSKAAAIYERRRTTETFDALYRIRPVRGPQEGEVTSDAKDLEECTFMPDTSLTRNARAVQPSHQPRGYREAVRRMREAQTERETLREEMERTTSNVAKASMNAKPFNFALDERRKNRQAPLLYMDVNLGPGKTGRIGIHAGDEPRALARSFAQAYQLDDRLAARLEDLIRQHMEGVGALRAPGTSGVATSTQEESDRM